MPKISLEDIKNMIIQERKTTSAYYGDDSKMICQEMI